MLTVTTTLRVGRRNDREIDLELSLPDTLVPGAYLVEAGPAVLLDDPDDADLGAFFGDFFGAPDFDAEETLEDVFARVNEEDRNVLLKARLTPLLEEPGFRGRRPRRHRPGAGGGVAHGLHPGSCRPGARGHGKHQGPGGGGVTQRKDHAYHGRPCKPARTSPQGGRRVAMRVRTVLFSMIVAAARTGPVPADSGPGSREREIGSVLGGIQNFWAACSYEWVTGSRRSRRSFAHEDRPVAGHDAAQVEAAMAPLGEALAADAGKRPPSPWCAVSSLRRSPPASLRPTCAQPVGRPCASPKDPEPGP